jgi:uncharacterized C2H2 Zn-finger protein
MVISRLTELRSMNRESTVSSSVTCPYCQKAFSNKSNVNRHVQSIHKNVKHTCTKCDKTFTRKANMDRHTCIHQTGQQREFRCKVIICVILFIFVDHIVTLILRLSCSLYIIRGLFNHINTLFCAYTTDNRVFPTLLLILHLGLFKHDYIKTGCLHAYLYSIG